MNFNCAHPPIAFRPIIVDAASDSGVLPPLRFVAQISSGEPIADDDHGSWMNLIWFAEIDDEKSIKAFVVRKPGIDTSEAALVEHCRSQLAKYKAPRAIEFLDALPKTASGKVQRFLLNGASTGRR